MIILMIVINPNEKQQLFSLERIAIIVDHQLGLVEIPVMESCIKTHFVRQQADLE